MMKHIEDDDYEFEPDQTMAWIIVGKLSVSIVKLDGAVKLAVYELGKECDGALFEEEVLEAEPENTLHDIA